MSETDKKTTMAFVMWLFVVFVSFVCLVLKEEYMNFCFFLNSSNGKKERESC